MVEYELVKHFEGFYKDSWDDTARCHHKILNQQQESPKNLFVDVPSTWQG
jgi:hypothetical protein